jgi:dihydroxyacid dehydratase/phosphogluconate dehydratase
VINLSPTTVVVRPSTTAWGSRLSSDAAVVTDGGSPETRGAAIGHVGSGVAAGRSIAPVEEGDRREIEVESGTVMGDLTDIELEQGGSLVFLADPVQERCPQQVR